MRNLYLIGLIITFTMLSITTLNANEVFGKVDISNKTFDKGSYIGEDGVDFTIGYNKNDLSFGLGLKKFENVVYDYYHLKTIEPKLFISYNLNSFLNITGKISQNYTTVKELNIPTIKENDKVELEVNITKFLKVYYNYDFQNKEIENYGMEVFYAADLPIKGLKSVNTIGSKYQYGNELTYKSVIDEQIVYIDSELRYIINKDTYLKVGMNWNNETGTEKNIKYKFGITFNF